MIEVKYTEHSLDRLKERGITKKEVEMALWRGKKENIADGRTRVSHLTKKGVLVVIYIGTKVGRSMKSLIITAYRE